MAHRRTADSVRQRLFVTALVPLVALVFLLGAGAVQATTFTLLELEQGQTFTIGNLEFFDFQINTTSKNTALLTVDTVDSDTLPGFVVNGNGLWSVSGPFDRDLEELDLTYQVRTVDEQPLIGGMLLWANDYSIENATLLDILAVADGGPALNVLIFEPFGQEITNLDVPADSFNLNPRLSSLMLESRMNLSIVGVDGPQGPGVLNSYSMLFPLVIPEPGTAALLGLGLAGLGVVGRSRREQSERTA